MNLQNIWSITVIVQIDLDGSTKHIATFMMLSLYCWLLVYPHPLSVGHVALTKLVSWPPFVTVLLFPHHHHRRQETAAVDLEENHGAWSMYGVVWWNDWIPFAEILTPVAQSPSQKGCTSKLSSYD